MVWKPNTHILLLLISIFADRELLQYNNFFFFILSNWSVQTSWQLAFANCIGLAGWNHLWLEN